MIPLLGLYETLRWALVPVQAGEKCPKAKGWPDRYFTIPDIAPEANVGVKLGWRSGYLADADLDCAEALALADIYLPPTGAIFGRPSKPQSHRLFVAAGAVFEAFLDPISGDTLLELRTDGASGGCHQTLVPPSVTNGERREWLGEAIEPATADARVLRRRCVALAVACLVQRYVGDNPARTPWAPGWDHPRLLWECDHELGRQAYAWRGQPAPDAPRRSPKPISERTSLEVDLHDLARAIQNNLGWELWNTVGMAFFAASNGSDEGFVAFDTFSAKHPAYDPTETAARWRNYRNSPPSRVGKGTLIYWARQSGWRPEGRRA